MSELLSYLKKHSVSDEQIIELPSENLKISIVIPSYNEENISTVLKSILSCTPPQGNVEVLLVLNTHENDSQDIIEITEKCKKDFYHIKKNSSNPKIQLHLIEALNLPKKHAGVGLARKIGMDESIRRFSKINNPHGIIACIDVDCTVEKNYLTELENLFLSKKAKGCSIRFEHPIKGNDFTNDVYKAIAQYELYLHYHLFALRLIEHPFAYHTIGSAFAVRADIYAKQGGMNQRKGGEDFYFLQKVIPLGNFFELNTTCIYPSPRISTRVPFGTGITIKKIIEQNCESYLVYNPLAYFELYKFFKEVFAWYENSNLPLTFQKISSDLKNYLENIDVYNRILEIKQNTSNFNSFKKRFFRWFNMFQVIKYLNYAHQCNYSKIHVTLAASMLLEHNSINNKTNNTIELLEIYRKIIYGNTLIS